MRDELIAERDALAARVAELEAKLQPSRHALPEEAREHADVVFMAISWSDDDSNSERYYRGFNHGVEFAKTEQAKLLETEIERLQAELAEATRAIAEYETDSDRLVGELSDTALAHWQLEQQLDSAQAIPAVDWSNAPDWAMYWAVGPDGLGRWHEYEPEEKQRPINVWDWYQRGRDVSDKRVFDWRTCKQRRPQPAPAQESSE